MLVLSFGNCFLISLLARSIIFGLKISMKYIAGFLVDKILSVQIGKLFGFGWGLLCGL